MLTVEEVHSRYGNAEILTGVSLHVGEGEVVALLGRNGMGKTTLVRTIMGTAPPRIHGGSITLAGEEISSLPSYEIARRGVGLVPQGRHVFGSLSVLENLTVTARTRKGGAGSAWDVDRVFHFFPRLADRRASRGRNLSGGEQQMLAIGRALMTNPDLLLMDEPSEGLAPRVVGQIRERVQTLKQEHLAILLVEQNLGFAMRAADRIYILGEGGRIAWNGTPEQLNADDVTKRTHLGV